MTTTLTTRKQRTQFGCVLLLLAYGAGGLVTWFPILWLTETLFRLAPDSHAAFTIASILSVIYTLAFVIVLGKTRGWWDSRR